MGSELFLPQSPETFGRNTMGFDDKNRRNESKSKSPLKRDEHLKKEERKVGLFETDIENIERKVNRLSDNRSCINSIYKKMFEDRRSNIINMRLSSPLTEVYKRDDNNNLKLMRFSSTEDFNRNVFLNERELCNSLEPSISPLLKKQSSDEDLNSSIIIKEAETEIGGSKKQELPSICIDKDHTNTSCDVTMTQVFKGFESKLQNAEKIRNQYYSKLILNNIWEMEKRNHNNIFIFDWDDTILSTTYITPNGYFVSNYTMKEKDVQMFKELDQNAFILLNLAIVKGKTFIVTNAVSGWVELSARIFLPEVSKILKHMTIISARESFQLKFPGNSRKWKIETFLHIQKCFKTNLVTNLICIGDSIIEMEAAHVISKKFSNMFLKTIKLMEKPKPEEVIKELKLMIKSFDFIFSSLKSLTINVEKKLLEERAVDKMNQNMEKLDRDKTSGQGKRKEKSQSTKQVIGISKVK